MLKGVIGRRVSQRVPFEAEINISFQLEGKEPIVASAMNISPGGLQFFVPKGAMHIPPDEIIELVINLPKLGDTTIQGEICYFSNAMNENRKPISCYGVRFLDLSLDTWNVINEFCQSKQVEETAPTPVEPKQPTTPVPQVPTSKPIAPTPDPTPIKPEVKSEPKVEVKTVPSQPEPVTPSIIQAHPQNSFQSLSQDSVDQLIRSISTSPGSKTTRKKEEPAQPQPAPKPVEAKVPIENPVEPKVPTENPVTLPEPQIIEEPTIISLAQVVEKSEEKPSKSLMDLVREHNKKESDSTTVIAPGSISSSADTGKSLMDMVLGFHKNQEVAASAPEPTKPVQMNPFAPQVEIKPAVENTVSKPVLSQPQTEPAPKPVTEPPVKETPPVPAVKELPPVSNVKPAPAPEAPVPSQPAARVEPSTTMQFKTSQPATPPPQPFGPPGGPAFFNPEPPSPSPSQMVKSSSTVSMDQEMIDRILNSMHVNDSKPVHASSPATPSSQPASSPAGMSSPTVFKSQPSVKPMAASPTKPQISSEPPASPNTVGAKAGEYNLEKTTVSIQLPNGRTIHGTVNSINFGGLMITLSEAVPIDSSIRIYLTCNDIRLSDLKGIITCSDPVAKNGKKEFSTGLFFENLTGADFDKLRTLIFKLRIP